MCGRIHIGPVCDVKLGPAIRGASSEGVEFIAQVCMDCKTAMSAPERVAYWRVQKRMLELKVAALRATIQPK